LWRCGAGPQGARLAGPHQTIARDRRYKIQISRSARFASMQSAVLRISRRAFAAPCRRLLSTSGGSSGSTNPSMLAGSGALLGAAALGSYAVFGQGGAETAKAVDEAAESKALENKLVMALEKRLAQLEVDVAGGKQMALVFIKPHACNPKVCAALLSV
jgi:hypothetical protein